MELTDNYQFNYQKLLKFLSRTDTDGYVFAMVDDFRFISQINSSLVSDLSLKSLKAGLVFLRSNTDVPMMQQIRNAATGSQALIIANLYDIVNNTKEGLAHLLYLNFSREELRSLNLPVLFWADAESLSTIANHAPDLFSQRRFTTIHFTGKVEHPVGAVFEKADWQEFANTEKFKDIEAKITTLERRLHDAEDTGYNKNRITNEIALPLAKEYAELGITADKAENLLTQYEPYFDNEDSRQLQQLAEVYHSLHNYQHAIEALQHANILIERKGNIYPAEWFENINSLSDWMVEYGIPNDALEILEKAEYILLDKKNSYTGFNADFSLMLMQGRIGDISMSSNNIEKGKLYYQQGLEAGKRFAQVHPGYEDYKRSVSVFHNKLGNIFQQLGDLQQAKEYYESALEIVKQLEKNNIQSEQLRRDVSVSYERLGNISQQLGNLQQAKNYYENALNIVKQLEKTNPHSEQLKRDVAVSYINLGSIEKSQQHIEKALFYYNDALVILKSLSERNPLSQKLKNDVTWAEGRIAALSNTILQNPVETNMDEKPNKDIPVQGSDTTMLP